MTERREVKYWIDESVTTVIGRFLRHTGFDAGRVTVGAGDPVNLARIRRHSGDRPTVLITADIRMKTDHSGDALRSGASVAWIHVNGEALLTQFFVAFTFAYQKHDQLRAAPTPCYFDPRLGEHNGLPGVEFAATAVREEWSNYLVRYILSLKWTQFH